MLRALGFQRRMVSWVFLIESSFVALPGIGLVVGLALIPASQMIADMATDIPGLTFQVPWTEIIFVSGLAYAMALLTTWAAGCAVLRGCCRPRRCATNDKQLGRVNYNLTSDDLVYQG